MATRNPPGLNEASYLWPRPVVGGLAEAAGNGDAQPPRPQRGQLHRLSEASYGASPTNATLARDRTPSISRKKLPKTPGTMRTLRGVESRGAT